MKELKSLVLLLGLFVVVMLGLLVTRTGPKPTATPAVANPEAEQAAPVPGSAESPALSEAPATNEAAAPASAADEGSGIRKSDPAVSGSEELPAPVSNAPAPGSAERLPRAYENAPPQIPHSIEGLVPITLGNNACFSCHLPGVAENVGATPLPPTHIQMDLFTESEGKKVPVDPARYNCTQCHVPQADVQPPVANEFQPEFRNPELKNKSNLDQQWNEGVQ